MLEMTMRNRSHLKTRCVALGITLLLVPFLVLIYLGKETVSVLERHNQTLRTEPPAALSFAADSAEEIELQRTRHMVLKPHKELLEEVQSFWQFPNFGAGSGTRQSNSVPNILGLVVGFHGCMHGGEDWFDLPEERRMVKYALANGFGFISFSSQQRTLPKCWNGNFPHETNDDAVKVTKALKAFVQREQIVSKPVFAVGASSGGTFVSIVLHSIKFHAVSIQISPGHHAALGRHMWLPPIYLIGMARDSPYAAATALVNLQNRLEPLHTVFVHICQPRPLTPTFMTDRIDGLSQEHSQLFYNVSRTRFLDTDDTLRENPRESDMLETLLREHEPLRLGSKMFFAMEEELNILYAQHELTSEKWPTVLNWFAGHL